HGVGYFLGVHEGPQDIRQNFNRTPILPGMITSNEPGLYREGMHGVRHENLVLCVEDGRNEFGDWLRFETITLCHFDTSAIIVDLLNSDEIAWLNEYNARVYKTLSPMLSPEEADWLRGKCKSI
ncbi:MAG: M24 family metallopeptidase C-terminal domain-containing protein, partial [Bacteroidales bacterium]|nr:M24 family metallopeptidase C-terminal domain-containing protein [Bacteroidales bacterium]